MKAFLKVFWKVFGGFCISYLIIMAIFTGMNSVEYDLIQALSMADTMNTFSQLAQRKYQSDSENKVTMPINFLCNTFYQMMYSEADHEKSALFLFKEGQCINKPGEYLYINGKDLEEGVEQEEGKYIDLNKWLSEDEVNELIIWAYEMENVQNKGYRIEVNGYIHENDEVYPEYIKLFEGNKEGEQLTHSYEFDVEKSMNKTSYGEAEWKVSIPIDYNGQGVKWLKENLQRVKEILGVEELDILNRAKQQNSINYKTIGVKLEEQTIIKDRTIETNTGTYELIIATTYKSVNTSMSMLTWIYIFSAIIVMITSIILSLGIWRNNKKKEQIEEGRRQLVDAIGHELKTPLAIIRSYSEGLREKIAEDKREHYLEVIMDETDKMDELVLEMISLSQLESKGYHLQIESFALNELVSTLLKNKEKLLKEKQLQVQVEIKETIILADYKVMSRAIHNLLINAIEYADEESTIQIGYRDNKLYVQNQGPAIPKKELKKIWQAFYKVAGGNNRTGKGTGIGLAVVAQACNQHKMTYGVENTMAGVRFWIGRFKCTVEP